MAEERVIIKESTLTAIGNSIRAKTGKTELINPDNMPAEIDGISSGGSGTGEDKLKLLFDAKKSCYYEFYDKQTLTDEQLAAIFTNPNVTSEVTDMTYMFYNCRALTSLPQIDTGNVITTEYMFYSCYNLKTIPQWNVSNATNLKGMFYNCFALESILMTGMSVNFDISSSTKFTRGALVTIINNLATVTSTKTLTMGSTNLDKLADVEKAIATNKGWTLT